MAFTHADAPQRRQDSCAEKTLIGALWQRLRQQWQQRKHPKVPAMNAHIARDIGLSAHDQALRDHQWPSQTMHHPRS